MVQRREKIGEMSRVCRRTVMWELTAAACVDVSPAV